LIEKDGSVSGVTSDHKPDNADEQQRISSAGGRVQFGRVDGELAMSRAIGDYNYKLDGSLTPTRQKVIAVPEYLELTADTDDVLLLCCDGLFEKLSTEQVATFIHLCMRKPNSQAQVCYSDEHSSLAIL
jgi:protein phosphatase 2C family protein 2/3